MQQKLLKVECHVYTLREKDAAVPAPFSPVFPFVSFLLLTSDELNKASQAHFLCRIEKLNVQLQVNSRFGGKFQEKQANF